MHTFFNQKGASFILLIMFISLLILGILGGAYYYLEIYNPTQYAKAVLPLYDQIRSQQMGTDLKGGGDYEGLLIALNQYEQSFTKWRDQLLELNPSPINNFPPFLNNTKKSQQIQEDLTKILDVFLSNIAKAKKQAQFMIKAKKLFLLIRLDLREYPPKAVPEGQGVSLPSPPNTVGEFLSVWETRITQANVVAEDLFSEPVDLGEESFEELKSLWQETAQGYDLLFPFLQRQDSNLTLSEVQRLIPEVKKVEFDKADDAADQFMPLLEKVLIRYSAENLLKFYSAVGSSTQSEFNLSTERLDTAIRDIQAKYSR